MNLKYVSPIIYIKGSYVNHNPKIKPNVAICDHLWPSIRLKRDITFKERNELIKQVRNG